MAEGKEVVQGSNKRSTGDSSGSSIQNELHWWTEINKRLKQSKEDHQKLKYEKLKELEDYFPGEQKTEEKWQQEFDGLKLQLQTLEAQHDIKMRKLKLELAEGMAKIKLDEGSDTNMEKMLNELADTKLKVILIDDLEKKRYKEKLKLKHNKVFCRVFGQYESVISYPTSVESHGRGIELSQSGNIYQFTFDKVFGGDASQENMFDEVSELITSALEGYKVFIFSYGHTDSGKSHTLMGKPEDPDQKGLIPRTVEKIATQLNSVHGREYKMQASVFEIYNETIRDMLELGVPGMQQYKIKLDENRNLTIVDVCSVDEISLLLEWTAKIWCVGKTQMNERSSRSHMVFALRISSVHEGIEQVQGVLNFVDLPGSEHFSNSKAAGDRLKETQVIDTSLSYLSDVLCLLAKKERVPYKNLTNFFEPYLGRDSKTLLVVNIAPNPSSVGESLSSLQFAANVR